jgi:16S rRNA (guanine966-N2)-methyltransferase
LRVIAGTLGGRTLTAAPGRATRPTSDRVREALFSMLESPGGRVLDLFAGSGALGIEALSRGAEHAVFVENERGAADAIAENLKALGLGPDVARLVRRDAANALEAAAKSGDTYDLVFIDPPYREAGAWAARLPALLAPVLAPGARLVAEFGHRDELEIPGEELRRRRYGDTIVKINEIQ